jgi:AcrR family transcriptional regulator
MSDIYDRKLDRRISRTRRNLQEALFDLILEKGFDSITVEEITTRADLGRTTFYLHYRDKEDLLMQAVRDQVDGLVSQLSQFPFRGVQRSGSNSGMEAVTPMIALAFQHVAQNVVFYRVLLRGEGTHAALQRLRQILAQAILELIRHFTQRDEKELNPTIPIDVFLNSLAGAWVGLMSWWLEEDMPYSPEEMAIMYQRMFMRSTLEVLGLAEQ